MCEDKIKVVEKVEKYLHESGMNVAELVSGLGKRNSSTLHLSDDMQTEFMKIYDLIEQGGHKAKKKGDLLEELTYIMFDKKIFNTLRSCRTTTNELDVLVEWTEEALLTGLNSAFPCFGSTFICECKNYSNKVGVSYVGKFLSLLIASSTSLGIFVSWSGVTGRGWSAANGVIKKAALGKGIYIVVLDKRDLKQIYDRKTNPLSLIFDKYKALKHDIDYVKWIEKHEAEDKLIQ